LNSGLDIYLDGVKASSIKSGTYPGMANTSSVLRIGNSFSNEFFNGKIDEVGIWKNRKLTDADVSELYSGGVGKFYPF